MRELWIRYSSKHEHQTIETDEHDVEVLVEDDSENAKDNKETNTHTDHADKQKLINANLAGGDFKVWFGNRDKDADDEGHGHDEEDYRC